MTLNLVLAFSLLGINLAICICAYWLSMIAQYLMKINENLKCLD